MVFAGLLQVGEPRLAGLEVGLQRLADPGSVGRFGLLFQPADPVLEAMDLGLDLLAAGALEEPLEHVLGVEHAQVDPEQAVEIGELELIERAQ